LTLLAGQALSTGDALYIASADGKAYKTDATFPNEKVENFIGFAASAVAASTNITVKTGPNVDGFAGLIPGSVYYLSSSLGDISTSPSSAFKPVGIATGPSTLYMFPTQAHRTRVVTPTLNLPAIGSWADTAIGVGFRAKVISINGYLGVCNAGGTQCHCITFQVVWEGTVNKGGTWVKSSPSTCNSFGNLFFSSQDPFVQTTSGSNDAKLTLSVLSVSGTTVVFRLANSIMSGLGSNNTQNASIVVTISG
jgi:hypothetical protein